MNWRKEVDKLIAIHEELKTQIVGSTDYHDGAIEVLNNLKAKLAGKN